MRRRDLRASDNPWNGTRETLWSSQPKHSNCKSTTLKCADPTTRIRIRGGDDRKAMNGEGACVVSGRVGRIRGCLLPRFGVGFRGVEFDASEEVFSCPMNPVFGNDAACFERRRFVA